MKKLVHQALLPALVCFMLLVPMLSSLDKYHSDERFYTDAVIRMVKSGTYLTPTYPNGQPRFKKPILSYWLIASAYKALGISPFASRLPFLLAGVALVVVTWIIARLLFPCTALAPPLAAWVIVSNIQVLELSVRSTPDIVACLFVSISIAGFASILFSERPSKISFMAAWVGAGLACATKGLIGLLPPLYAAIFAATNCPAKTRRAQLRSLLDFRAIALGTFLATGWYLAVIAVHGKIVLVDFLGDQVASKGTINAGLVIGNLLSYASGIVSHFLPWTALLLFSFIVLRKSVMRTLQEHRRQVWFVAGWLALFVVIFSWSNMNRTRFLIYTYPLIAVLIGGVLANIIHEARPMAFLRGITTTTLWIGMVTGGVFTLAGSMGQVRLVAGGCILLLSTGGLLLYRGKLRRSATTPALAEAALLSTSLIMLYSAIYTFLVPVLQPSPAYAFSKIIEGQPTQVTAVEARGVSAKVVSQVRMLLKGDLPISTVDDSQTSPSTNPLPLIITEGRYLSAIDRKNYTLIPAGIGYSKWTSSRILGRLRATAPDFTLQPDKQVYYVAVPEHGSALSL